MKNWGLALIALMFSFLASMYLVRAAFGFTTVTIGPITSILNADYSSDTRITIAPVSSKAIVDLVRSQQHHKSRLEEQTYHEEQVRHLLQNAAGTATSNDRGINPNGKSRAAPDLHRPPMVKGAKKEKVTRGNNEKEAGKKPEALPEVEPKPEAPPKAEPKPEAPPKAEPKPEAPPKAEPKPKPPPKAEPKPKPPPKAGPKPPKPPKPPRKP